MNLKSLTIAPRNAYSPASESNPYEARLAVAHHQNQMVVALSPEVTHRLLELLAAEITAAAQIQIEDFVQAALAVSPALGISGEAQA